MIGEPVKMVNIAIRKVIFHNAWLENLLEVGLLEPKKITEEPPQ